MTKRKEERRELLKEDEFLSFLDRSARYIQQNPRKVLLQTVGVIVALALFFGWLAFKKDQRNEKAQVLYGIEEILEVDLEDEKATLKFDSEKERLEAALAEIDSVIESESGIVKQQAMIYKIRSLTNLGRQDELEPIYRELIEDDKGLKFLGMMGLGDLFFAQGKHEEALEQYDQVSRLQGIPDLGEFISYKKALCYQGSGDLENAREALNDLLSKYDESSTDKPPIYAKAQTLLDEIKEDNDSSEEETAGT